MEILSGDRFSIRTSVELRVFRDVQPALPYVERLKSLKLPSLLYRRKRGDMIFAYQLLHNQFDMDNLFSIQQHTPPQGATTLLQVYSVGETIFQ